MQNMKTLNKKFINIETKNNNKPQILRQCRCLTPNIKNNSSFDAPHTMPKSFLIKRRKSNSLLDTEIIELSRKEADLQEKYKLTKNILYPFLSIEDNYYLLNKMHLQGKILQLKKGGKPDMGKGFATKFEKLKDYKPQSEKEEKTTSNNSFVIIQKNFVEKLKDSGLQSKKEQEKNINSSSLMKEKNYIEKVKEYKKVFDFMGLRENGKRKKPMKLKNSKIIFRKIAEKLCYFLNLMGRLKLSLSEIVDVKDIFPSKPFQHLSSFAFLTAVKRDNQIEAKKLLESNKYLVYDYNHKNQTALHFACQNDNLNLINELINMGADIDHKDINGTNPLIISIRKKSLRAVQILLLNKANAWYVQQNLLLNVPEEIKNLIKSARRISLLLKMTVPAYREAIWRENKQEFLKI